MSKKRSLRDVHLDERAGEYDSAADEKLAFDKLMRGREHFGALLFDRVAPIHVNKPNRVTTRARKGLSR